MNFNPSPEILHVKTREKFSGAESADAVIHCIENHRPRAVLIGEGGNGNVLALEDDVSDLSHVCLKEVRDMPVMKGYEMSEEVRIQNHLYEHGVRTPLVYSLLEGDDGRQYFLMERIFGKSVGEIIATDSKLPEDFDVHAFLEDLKIQIGRMHDAGVVHRDLRTGNVMIDKDGKAVIIDFGCSSMGSGYNRETAMYSELPYEESVMIWEPTQKRYVSKTGYFMNDYEAIKLLGETLRTYVRRSRSSGPARVDQFGQSIE